MKRDITDTSDTKRRRDAGILHITERDLLVLNWIAEQFCLSFDHLRRLLGLHAKATTKAPGTLSISATRDAVQRWEQLGLIEPPRKIIAEYPPYLWLSRRGITQLGSPYPYYEPRPATIRHLYAVNAVRLTLESHSLQGNWISYRTLRRQSQTSPIPDADLFSPTLPRIAVRVIERPPQHPITIRDELATMEALTTLYSRFWYFVDTNAYTSLITAVRDHDATVNPDKQLSPCIAWFTLETQEIQEIGEVSP
ncbi:hypothetical protein EPA93_43235 [Ktedonosporobacter rubrisoli]|uniref:Uncharacterized protein n=1 Tax=Ktedonosporobacter rubrisoli TaxID=2509675 RepID=A0A4P6K3R5_KTERU|nr:hypothetical protein [Ktedonosporobacter rubrisoli]QBD82430.1 hypothetical protein EPA93_43235 [Ktedonosporobacter rubrisoli]